MTERREQQQPSSSRRASAMRRRYSNLGSGLVVASSNSDGHAAAKAANAEAPKSFALEMKRIPSFNRLNGDSLFDEDDGFVVRRPSKSERKTTNVHSTTAPKERSHHRRPRTSSRKTSDKKNKRDSIQIQETKVMTQRVSSKEDALFMDGSSRTASTASSHTRSSVGSSSPFSIGSSSKDDLDEFDMETDNLFRIVSDLNKNINKSRRPAEVPEPSTNKSGNPKYRKLGEILRAAREVTDDVYFVPPNSTPADLMPLSAAMAPPTPKPRRAKQQSGRRPRRSHSLTTPEDLRHPAAKSSYAPKETGGNHSSRRSLRRSSMVAVTSSLHHRPAEMQQPEDSQDARQLLSLMPKSDDDDDTMFDGSNGKKLHSSMQPNQWSLQKIVTMARENRRSHHSRQQQQEDLCQHFFGGAAPVGTAQ